MMETSKTWNLTMNLRCFYPSTGHATQGIYYLQQQKICIETGETEWTNVPSYFEVPKKTN